MSDVLLYLAQAVCAAAYAYVLEYVFQRRYEPGLTWLTVVWGVAQVGLLIALRLLLDPLRGMNAAAGGWAVWWMVFWSFVFAGLPIVGWQIAVDYRRVQRLAAYVMRRIARHAERPDRSL